MTQYILFSFFTGEGDAPTAVSVPYNSEMERDYLLRLLKTGADRDGADRACLELVYNFPPLISPIQLWHVTHFVQQD